MARCSRLQYTDDVQRGRRRPPHRSEPKTVASLMADVIAKLGGEARGAEQSAFTAWTQSVGEVFATRTRAERLLGSTLFVRVESSALAHELSLLKGEILLRLTKVLGPGVVNDLRTRVGPLDG